MASSYIPVGCSFHTMVLYSDGRWQLINRTLGSPTLALAVRAGVMKRLTGCKALTSRHVDSASVKRVYRG